MRIVYLIYLVIQSLQLQYQVIYQQFYQKIALYINFPCFSHQRIMKQDTALISKAQTGNEAAPSQRVIIRNNYILTINIAKKNEPKQSTVFKLDLEILIDQTTSLIYTKDVYELDQLGRMREYCDNFEEVAEYMAQGDNFLVEVTNQKDKLQGIGQQGKYEEARIIIYGTHLLKKDRTIQLCSIKLNYQMKQLKTRNQLKLQRKLTQLEQTISQLKKLFATKIEQQPASSLTQEKTLQKYVTKKQLKEEVSKIKQDLLHQYHNYINSFVHQHVPFQPPSLMDSSVECSIIRAKDLPDIEASRERQISIAKVYDHIIGRLSVPSLIFDVKEEGKQQAEEDHKNNLDKKENETNKEINMNDNIGKILVHRLEQFIAQTQFKINILTRRISSMQSICYVQKSHKNSGIQAKKEKQVSSSDNNKQPEPLFKPIIIEKWVDPKCLQLNKFTINNEIIVAKECSLIFGCLPIQKQYTFCVTIIKMSKFIQLGIVDRKCSNNSTNLAYYQNDGSCKYGVDKKKQGGGFKMGESVRVEVNRGLGTVEWCVGEQSRLKIKYDKIRKNEVEWVPYLYLGSAHDSVSIYE